ncbi:cytidine deaminase [Mycoplasma struthionis]|uniref:Cytidine deaminase n=1 Tax=Mycoplasma struthionis TaxID=538220 RepID=A0A3G8LHZ6_9MOLU|nr:cytidine deaminase [Mycoplasma struthionis]AZG68855.1 cytidine deaminase [Mycoplasma struthionis]TPI01307.1 cytidine deaminase [Mycoplasma struthionis]
MKLEEKIVENLKYAYVPYSHVQVSACAIDENGKEYYGVNCENPAYPSGLCAERSALFSAPVQGATVGTFKEIHVTSNMTEIIYPCAGCLQVISTFLKPDGLVYLYKKDLSEKRVYKVTDLLPHMVRDEDIKKF